MTQFVGNVSQNPLAFGHNETTRSNFRIFNADGGGTISNLASSQDFFFETRTSLFERMINTVPQDVVLSDMIEAVPVKPKKLFVAVNTNGTMTISGILRVRCPDLVMVLITNGHLMHARLQTLYFPTLRVKFSYILPHGPARPQPRNLCP